MPSNPESPGPFPEESETRRRYYIDRLRSCLDDWSDEIPVEIVHNEGKAKVRSAWFTLVDGWVELALEFLNDALFSEEIHRELDPVIAEAKAHTEAIEGENRNTKEQVDACNLLLKKVIERLERA